MKGTILELNYNELLHSPSDLTLEHIRAIIKSFEQEHGEDWELDVQEHHLKEIREYMLEKRLASFDEEDWEAGVDLGAITLLMQEYMWHIVEQTSLREQVATVQMVALSQTEVVLTIG